MSTERVFNFSAGPAILPFEVLVEIRDNFMNFDGISVLEISHRSKAFVEIIDESRDLISELLDLPKGYQVLFLQGGARQQFAMVPLNLLDKSADYAITGYWSLAARDEAETVGNVRVAFSSEAGGFSRVPSAYEVGIGDDADYLHITTNNTIYGTQYREFPDTRGVPLVADMSSDFLSRKIDISRFGLVYAGAQKNAGPAGVTIVIIRDDLLGKNYRRIPSIFRYSSHAEKNSLYNTPPVFAIYALRFVMRWLKKNKGVEAIEGVNREKAAIVYDVLDSSDFYRSPVEKDSRSMMNVTFALPTEDLTARFIEGAKRRRLVGLKGHRLIGGVRASMYNAFPVEGAVALAEFMREFERREGRGM